MQSRESAAEQIANTTTCRLLPHQDRVAIKKVVECSILISIVFTAETLPAVALFGEIYDMEE